ncbi:MAG: hypothetical protein Ta2E_10280 [Mycoplasmoidaceae bacterium]|nr:MAG: hypothetical protein Ta2E_10280 [Mycoplasmoidaceae bacterium]
MFTPDRLQVCPILILSVTITKSIKTLIYLDSLIINEITDYIDDDYSNLHQALLSDVLYEGLLKYLTVNLYYCNWIRFRSSDPVSLNCMPYNVSQISGIKQYQFSVVSNLVENLITGQAEDEDILETIHVLKKPSYGDYNRTPVCYLRSNLRSNFFVQLHVEDEKEANKSWDIITNTNIFMRITNAFLPNLPIAFTGGDDKNDCHLSALISGGYIQLFGPNLHHADIISHDNITSRWSLLVHLYHPSI